FSLVFGFFMTRIPQRQAETMLQFWQGIAETMMLITMWIMKFAPLGVFGLVAATVASTGFAAFRPMAVFFFTVLGALMFHLLVVLPLLLRFVAKLDPWRHLRNMMPSLLTPFSSASSSATLPLTMDCVHQQSRVS